MLNGIAAQREIRAKDVVPFECIETAAAARELLEGHDAWVFDCDGVLWSGSLGLLPGSARLLAELAALGKRVIFVTNNSARSRQAYAEKFAQLGLAVKPEQIVPSSFAAARWLKRNRPSIEAAYVIGEAGVEDELRAVGVDVVRCAAGAFSEAEFASASADPRVGAVVVGADSAFSFAALAGASLCLEQLAGCLFVATNADDYDVVGDRRLPGNGALVAAIQAASGRPPDAVCGKPSADLAEFLLEEFELDPARTIVVGDRLDTDIALAHAMGASSLLVLTGVASASDASKVRRVQPECPTAVISHVGGLLVALEADDTSAGH